MILAGVVFVVIFSDQISSSLLKPFFQRLRPSHNPDIENLVHIVNDSRGGLYGFVSSHAANTFGVATFVALVFRHKGITPVIYFWPMLVSYSRIYLAKHYLGDIIGGAIVGVLVACAVYLIITVKTKDLCVDTRLNYGKFMLVAIIANVLYISVMACFYVL